MLYFHPLQSLCLTWKSEKVSFNQAIKELKDNFKIVDNFIRDENVNSSNIAGRSNRYLTPYEIDKCKKAL